jgi:hypothetical protein
MNSRDQQLGQGVRFLVGGFWVVLLVLFALSAYATWAIDGKYFRFCGLPRIGWADTAWVVVSFYF